MIHSFASQRRTSLVRFPRPEGHFIIEGPFRRGVTLLEILVAVVILSITAASLSALVRHRRSSAVDCRIAAHELATSLRAARMTAITRQASVEVRLSNTPAEQWLPAVASSQPVTGQPLLFHVSMPQSVTVTSWPGRVIFSPSGLPDQGINAVVAGSNSRFRVIVYAASGIVRVDIP